MNTFLYLLPPPELKIRLLTQPGCHLILLCALLGGLEACVYHSQKPSATSLSGIDSPLKSEKQVVVERKIQKALNQAEDLGPANPFLLSGLYSLAAFYRDQKEFAKAESIYQRILDLKEKTSGPDHPDIVIVLEQYSLLLKLADRGKEAELLETRARSIRAKQTASSHTPPIDSAFSRR